MSLFFSGKANQRDLEVDVPQVAAAIESDSHVVLDVREPDEWQAGHIDGAIHIPLGELVARAAELPANKPVFTVCHVGVRSLYAVQFLEQLGRPGAKSLAGGMDAWEAAGQPVEH